jgi:hypothetical protein
MNDMNTTEKSEKSFFIRFNLTKDTDRRVWEWLHERETGQTVSVNAFIIEALRRSMENALSDSDIERIATALAKQLPALPSSSDALPDPAPAIKTPEESLPDDVMDFLDTF